MRRAVVVVVLTSAAAAGACATWQDTTVAGYEGLRPQIVQHYRGRAMEANGSCPNPEITSITRAEVVRETPEEVEMLVRYRWVDEGQTTDLSGGGSKIVCTDWSTRRFTFARAGDALTLRSMSGPQ